MRTAKISKEQIIAATGKVIDKYGLENATIDKVAEVAGVAKGSIYVYFKSKDELLNQTIVFISEQKIALLQKLLAKVGSPLAKIKLLLDANAAYAKKQPESLLTNYALLISSHQNLRTTSSSIYLQKYHMYLTKLVKQAINKKELQNADPELIALILILIPDLLNILKNTSKEIIKLDNLNHKLLTILKK